MAKGDGHSFYVVDNGQIRNFMVGEEDEETAKLILQSQFPHINFLDFVAKELVGGEVIKMLGLTGGKGCEWIMGDTNAPAQPRGDAIGK
jgi:hypothetical protein